MAHDPHTPVRPRTDVLVILKRSGRGGVERIALRLAAGWRDARLVVERAVSPPGRQVPQWLEMLQLLQATRRLVRERQPRILFCPGNAYTVVAVLLKLLLGGACPPIVAKISNDLRRPDMARPLRPFYRLWLLIQGVLIDEFAALSPAMAVQVVDRMRVPARRVHVVANPVLSGAEIEQDVSRPLPLPHAGRRFVAVGRLEPQKKFALMLRAFARGSDARDTLTIFGEGRERASLTRLAETLGVTGRVRFAGYCGAIRDQLANHDILLLSSDYEGHPGVLIEALSVGLDVVATNCCTDMPDLLDDGALGHLVPRGDETALAAAIAASRAGAQDRVRAHAKARASTLEAALPAYAALFAVALARAGRRGNHIPDEPRLVAATAA